MPPTSGDPSTPQAHDDQADLNAGELVSNEPQARTSEAASQPIHQRSCTPPQESLQPSPRDGRDTQHLSLSDSEVTSPTQCHPTRGSQAQKRKNRPTPVVSQSKQRSSQRAGRHSDGESVPVIRSPPPLNPPKIQSSVLQYLQVTSSPLEVSPPVPDDATPTMAPIHKRPRCGHSP